MRHAEDVSVCPKKTDAAEDRNTVSPDAAMAGQPELLATAIWRRLDQPGHDCCRLFRHASGWKLSGAAVFSDSGEPCHVTYDVVVDSSWRTRRARLAGFHGSNEIEMSIHRGVNGTWRVGSAKRPAVDGCIDIDLGFTPATNLIAIRRLDLRIGERAEAPAAWLSLPRSGLEVLEQRYRRLTTHEYEYEAPAFGYKGRLRVSDAGMVEDYPGLFESAAGASPRAVDLASR